MSRRRAPYIVNANTRTEFTATTNGNGDYGMLDLGSLRALVAACDGIPDTAEVKLYGVHDTDSRAAKVARTATVTHYDGESA